MTGGQQSVGLRVPSHPVAQALLKEFGGGVAAPSANRFGRISPTTAAHVREDLGSEVDLVLEGGPSEVGIESTIVDLSGGDGGSAAPGRNLAGRSAADRRTEGEERLLAAAFRRPGAPLLAAHAGAPGADARFSTRRSRSAVTGSRCWRSRVLTSGSITGCACRASRRAMRSSLYAALRELDGTGCELILVEAPPEAPEWAAVRDRLLRACG